MPTNAMLSHDNAERRKLDVSSEQLKPSATESSSSASASETSSTSSVHASCIPFKYPFRFLVELLLSLFLLFRLLFDVLLGPGLGLFRMQIIILDPSRVRAVLAAHHLVWSWRVRAAIRAKSRQVEGAYPRVFDMAHRAVRSQRAESARVVRAGRPSQFAGGRYMEVRAVVAR